MVINLLDKMLTPLSAMFKHEDVEDVVEMEEDYGVLHWQQMHDHEVSSPDLIDKMHERCLDLDKVSSVDHELIRYVFHSDAGDFLEYLHSQSDGRLVAKQNFDRFKQRGTSIIECAAAMTLFIPICLTILFSAVEVVQCFAIQAGLTDAANRAARGLCVEYWKNGEIAHDRALQDSLVLDHVRVFGVVNNSAQFEPVEFDELSLPPVVSVTVTYTGNQYGLAPFPFADPLRLGTSTIRKTCVRSIE